MKYWGSATRDHGLLTAGVPLDESLAEIMHIRGLAFV